LSEIRLGKSFHQQATVNKNVFESDFVPLCDGTVPLVFEFLMQINADYLFLFCILSIFHVIVAHSFSFSLCFCLRGVMENWQVLETATCHLWTVWRRRTGSWGWKWLSYELAWRPTTRPGRTSMRERYYKIRTRTIHTMPKTGTKYFQIKMFSHLNPYSLRIISLRPHWKFGRNRIF